MDNRQTALKMAEILNEKKAEDLMILDIGATSGFADYFVIATAGSLRQLQSLSDELEDKMAQLEVFPKHIEGRGESGWILMDFGDIIVNIFTSKQREHYQIERIWSDCPTLEVITNE